MEVEEHGVRYFLQEGVIYGDTIAWDLDLWSPSGSEAEDRELFEQLLTRFRRLR